MDGGRKRRVGRLMKVKCGILNLIKSATIK